jgi:hypothetical protein
MIRRLAPLLPDFTFENNGLRCLAHPINNAIRRMFTVMHCDGFDSEEVAANRLNILPMGAERQDIEDMPDNQERRDNTGPIPAGSNVEVLDFERVLNKIRRLVYSVRLSDKRRRALGRHCQHTDISYRVPTLGHLGRWNSTHDMLDNILHLQRPLRLLSLDDRRLDMWLPTAHEWDMVKRFKEILAKYKEATVVMESQENLTITLAFPVVDRYNVPPVFSGTTS